MVVGCPGSGKSTLAQRLGEKLGLRVIHLDVHYWQPGWRALDVETWRERAAGLATEPQWIMDGNFPDTYDIRMPRADTLILLDHPRVRCLWRVLARLARDRRRDRADLPAGCPESFDPALLLHIWNFPSYGRSQILDGVARHGSHLAMIRLADDQAVDAFLQGCV
jgi:adenylate kinase family enzyme